VSLLFVYSRVRFAVRCLCDAVLRLNDSDFANFILNAAYRLKASNAQQRCNNKVEYVYNVANRVYCVLSLQRACMKSSIVITSGYWLCMRTTLRQILLIDCLIGWIDCYAVK
jgi:hypothetical protein